MTSVGLGSVDCPWELVTHFHCPSHVLHLPPSLLLPLLPVTSLSVILSPPFAAAKSRQTVGPYALRIIGDNTRGTV